jgi:hypothetical protein
MNALEIISLEALTAVTGGGTGASTVDGIREFAGCLEGGGSFGQCTAEGLKEMVRSENEEACRIQNSVLPGSCDMSLYQKKTDTPTIGYVTTDLGDYGKNSAGRFWLGQ